MAPPTIVPAPAGARPLLRRLLPLALVALALLLAWRFDLASLLGFDSLAAHRQDLVAFVATNHLLAALGFIAAYTLVTALSLPVAAPLSVFGGFLFGTVLGGIYIAIGATLGASLIFLAARTVLADLLRAKAGPWLARLEEGFRKDALNYLLVLRLVPLFPFFIVNLVPAFLGVSLRTFVLATAVGIIPGVLVFASIGNGLGAILDAGGRPDLSVLFSAPVLLPLLGLAALALVPVVYRKLKPGRA